MSHQVPSPAQVWELVVAELTSRPDVSLNTAVESCGRWASDRGRLALIVCHPDGRADRWTYYELDRAAARAACVFSRAGLRRGDRLAAILTRQVEAFIAALAAWRSGLVYVPLFCGFGPDALAQRLRAADASAVVVDHRWRDVLSAACEQLERDLGMVTVAGAQGRGVQHGMDLTPSDLLFSTSDPGWSYGLYTTGCAPMALGRPRVIYTGDFDAAAWVRVIEDQDVTFVAGAPSASGCSPGRPATTGCPRRSEARRAPVSPWTSTPLRRVDSSAPVRYSMAMV